MVKTDVFIRVFSSSELRLGFAIATVARWKMQEDVRVTILACKDFDSAYDWQKYAPDCILVPNEKDCPFATRSLKLAEEFAESDPYIICNDDNLIYGSDFVHNGLKIMEQYPDFGCVSGVVVNGDQYDMEKEITEVHAVGGCVFLRKGLVTEFPPLEDCFWDGERHKQVAEKGFKSGYTPKCPYLHMGAKFSIANPAHYVGA